MPFRMDDRVSLVLHKQDPLIISTPSTHYGITMPIRFVKVYFVLREQSAVYECFMPATTMLIAGLFDRRLCLRSTTFQCSC